MKNNKEFGYDSAGNRLNGQSGDTNTITPVKGTFNNLNQLTQLDTGGDGGKKSGNCHVATSDIIEGAGGKIPDGTNPPGLNPGLRVKD